MLLFLLLFSIKKKDSNSTKNNFYISIIQFKIPRNALVTGAARGIGRAIALRLATDGLNVAVNDIKASLSALNEVQQEIEQVGRQSLVIGADVSSDKEVQNMMKYVSQELGSLDVRRFLLLTAYFTLFYNE